MQEILALGPLTATLVPEVRFRLGIQGEKKKAWRPLLVISTHEQDSAGLERIREAYLRSFEKGFISFPIPERSVHLFTRIGREAFNFGHWGRYFGLFVAHFRQRKFRVPRKKALEVVLRLSEEEESRLQIYLQHILRHRFRTIGKFSHEGTQFTRSELHNNRPLTLKHGHNCSSWIATAPLGENREALLELLGTNRHCEIGTNPGWWTNWLAAAASPERVPFVILWTNEPIATVLARDLHPERGLTWDFNRQ